MLGSTTCFVFPEQSLAKLQGRFHVDQSIGTSEPDLRSSPVSSRLSLSRQTLDVGSQTSISGDVSHPCGRALIRASLADGTGARKGVQVRGVCMQHFVLIRLDLQTLALSFLPRCQAYQNLSR